MWVEFVVSSCPCSEDFSPSIKIDTPNFQFDVETVEEMPLCKDKPIPLKRQFPRHQSTGRSFVRSLPSEQFISDCYKTTVSNEIFMGRQNSFKRKILLPSQTFAC